MTDVRVELLGPLRLTVGGAAVEVVGTKRRAVLALLALAEGRTVPTSHLIDALWPTEDAGRAALQNHISRLRRHLGPAADRLRTQPAGYRLELAPDSLDIAQARALLAAATTSADPYAALRRAFDLWRGPVLADLQDIPAVATGVGSCERLRREVTDALVDAAIRTGPALSIVEIAEQSYRDDPLREPAALLFMRVLAAVGRAPDALRTGTEFRQRLADETGLDPSPALDAVARDIARGATGPATQNAAPENAAPQEPAPTGHPSAPARVRRPAAVLGRLVGRDSTVASLHRLLAGERLVTLVGPGGVGKTRVALEVGQRSELAAALMLATVADPAAIPHALAAALDLHVVQGDPLSACVGVLGRRPGLLLIDNCEHLPDAVRDLVETILPACPDLSVLATSREPLGLAGEYVSRLAPLPLPEVPAGRLASSPAVPEGRLASSPGVNRPELASVASVALFVERAARARPETMTPDQLSIVADVVRRLDGMPLAIELAAGRLSTFSLEDLRDRLDRALDLLGRPPSSVHGGQIRNGRDGDRRHATLRATTEWSYALLDEDQRRLFRNLSVFVDGADIEAVERVGAELGLTTDPGSVLARLVDASMVVADLTGRPRYRMLHLLRDFGLDQLADGGEKDAAIDRLIRWAVDLTGSIEQELLTDDEPVADATLRRELPNLRYAWHQARARGALDAAAAMVSALHDSITYRDINEIREWAAELADDPAVLGHPRAAAVLGTAAEAAYHAGDYARADALARRGLDLAYDDAGRWRCLTTLCVVDLARDDHDACVAHALAAADLGRPLREEFGIAALAHAYRGRLGEARDLNARGLAEARSPSMRSWGAYVEGEIDNFAGHPDEAAEHYTRAIELARESGATFLVGVATLGLLTVRAAAGQVHEALAGFRDVVEYFARNGDWTHQWVVLRNLATLLRRIGAPESADQLDAAADRAGLADRTVALDIARRAVEAR